MKWDAICSTAELEQSYRVVSEPGASPRTSTPSQTMARLEPYLPDYGITRVANVTWLDRIGIPVHTAHKPQGKSISNGSGKGVTPDASRVGAMMEAVEQTYWEDVPPPRIRATYEQLLADGLTVVDPLEVAMIRGNLWHPRLEIHWTAMINVRTGETWYVPADLVSLPWRTDLPRISMTHMAGSNGLASGANVVEAMISGLTEVMERDACSLAAASHRGEYPLDALDIDALAEMHGDPLASLIDLIRAADVTLHLFDLTQDMGLPTYDALLTDAGEGGTGNFAGHGSSLIPSTAIVRAVTEAVQARGLITAGARDDQFRCARDASRLVSQHRRSYVPQSLIEPMRYDDLSTGTLTGDAEVLVEMIEREGLGPVLVHRHTDEHDPVQVVRIVVPGLEGYMFSNYARGRRAREMAAKVGVA